MRKSVKNMERMTCLRSTFGTSTFYAKCMGTRIARLVEMMIKPILFNTDMVRAIQEDRKTVTRRVVKGYTLDYLELDTDGSIIGVYDQFEGHVRPVMDYSPFHPGDILYVRETWRIWRAHRYDADAHIEFKAGGEGVVLRFPHGYTDSANRDDYDNFIHKWGVRENKWHPSIHMPREAARIFLRVTDVRVERLQDITYEDCLREGITDDEINERDAFRPVTSARRLFERLWNSTIKKKRPRPLRLGRKSLGVGH